MAVRKKRTRELLAKEVRDHADPLWQDMKEARKLGLHDTEVALADIVNRIHEVGRALESLESPAKPYAWLDSLPPGPNPGRLGGE